MNCIRLRVKTRHGTWDTSQHRRMPRGGSAGNHVGGSATLEGPRTSAVEDVDDDAGGVVQKHSEASAGESVGSAA